jgi:hypothetical protein
MRQRSAHGSRRRRVTRYRVILVAIAADRNIDPLLTWSKTPAGRDE